VDLRQLEFVVAVAEELSFTRAAARCHIVQSGLSHQISRLERELGQPLFERTSRSVRLTPAGAALLPYARRVLRELEEAVAEVSSMSGTVQGTLRLGVIPVSHGGIDLPGLLQAYHRRHPAVDVIVSDTGSLAMAAMLLSGALDAAFLGLFADQLPPGLSHELLEIEPLVAIVDEAHPCALRRTVDLADLGATGGFIECHHDSGLRAQVDAAFERAGLHRHVAFELGNLMDVARMAALGLGVAIVPISVAEALPEDAGRFSVLRLNDARAVQPVALVFRDPPPSSPAALAFIEQLRDSVGDPLHPLQELDQVAVRVADEGDE
jgi:DNA-binding transcriptional LysR family regulator